MVLIIAALVLTMKQATLPKGQREGSYILRVLRFNVSFEDPLAVFKYGLQWLGSWELRNNSGQSQEHARVGHDLTTKPPPLGLIENGETGIQRRKKLASRSHSLLVWLCPVATIRIKGQCTPSVRLTLLTGKDHRAHQKYQGPSWVPTLDSRIPCYC